MKKYFIAFLFFAVLSSNMIFANAFLPLSDHGFLTNTFSKYVTSNGTIFSNNYSSPIHFQGTNILVTGSNNSKTVYITVPSGTLPPTTTCAANYGFVKYNNTLNQFTCKLLNQTGSGTGVSSLNALTGAINIAGVNGNTTSTVSGQTITINTAWNMVTTGGAAQTFTKQVSFSALINFDYHVESHDTSPSLSNCGVSPSIAGNDVIGKITLGSGTITSCIVTFVHSWTNPPSCMTDDESMIDLTQAVTTTSQFTINSATALGAGNVIKYICMGYN